MYSSFSNTMTISDEESEADWPNSPGSIEVDETTNDRRRTRSRIMDMSDSGEDAKSIVDDIDESDNQTEWFPPRRRQPQIEHIKDNAEMEIFRTDCVQAHDFFEILVPNNLLQEIADETNNYVCKILQQYRCVRLSSWAPTSREEIKKLFALILWMGIFKLPEISFYWSKDPFFEMRVPDSLMSRSRFEILLRMIHFVDDTAVTSERLDKMKRIVETLNKNFQKYYRTEENVCVEESIIPFRGRHSYKRYVKQKRHKLGFSIFKLCSKNGYTHSFQIYDGKNLSEEMFTPQNVILTLSESILEKGHTIYADSWFTSLDLALNLVKRNTHLVGTIRSNCPGLDTEVVSKELKRGGAFGKEHKTGVTLLKWRDKRDVLALSTKHSVDEVYVNIKGQDCARPALIVDYIDNRSPVELPDEITGCCSPLRKILKWYQKLALELILNTAVVNAWILFNAKTNAAATLLQYKKSLILDFLIRSTEVYAKLEDKPVSLTIQHNFEREPHEKGKQRKRNRCKSCYTKNVKNHNNSSVARIITKKVSTYCSSCPKRPFLCRPCFNELHFIQEH